MKVKGGGCQGFRCHWCRLLYRQQTLAARAALYGYEPSFKIPKPDTCEQVEGRAMKVQDGGVEGAQIVLEEGVSDLWVSGGGPFTVKP